MQIQFYHLRTTPLQIALPKLIEKGYAANMRMALKCADEGVMKQWNDHLWTYNPDSFLPHGSLEDPAPESQPLLISHTLPPLNNPDLLLVTDGTMLEDTNEFDRLFDIFDGNDDAAVVAARQRWKAYKESGAEMAYIRQQDDGSWKKEA